MIKLLRVPKEQIDWFDKEYSFLTNENYPNEGADVDGLRQNICGNEYRLNYDGNSNSLTDGFWLGYSCCDCCKTTVQIVLDIILSAMMDAIEREFFEIAENIRLVHEVIMKEIVARESFESEIIPAHSQTSD